MPLSDAIVKKVLLEKKMLSDRKIEKALKEAKKEKMALHTVLVQSKCIDKDELNQAIAKFFGVPYTDLSEVALDVPSVKDAPKVTAKDQDIMVYRADDTGIYIVSDNPQDTKFADKLMKKLHKPVHLSFADADSIAELRSRDNVYEFEEFAREIDPYIKQGSVAGRAEDLPVIKIVDEILAFAYANKTSDIHIEPYEQKTLIRFRIDGLLHDIIDIPKNLHELIATRIKILARLRTDEHQAAQDGKLRFPYEKDLIDVRVSILPIVRGEKVVMRILADQSGQAQLEHVGFRPEDFEKISEAIKKPWGMILTTGPTGSGKTTTLYSIIKKLDRREVNISTIEDPVEYDMEGISQIQVNNNTNLTFASGLRAIVRQDPDIIMVGEIRDEETAKIAVNAAMTGHLVLSTLHTNDASTTLPRLLDMGVQPFLVGSTINVAIAQRLVRKICKDCKRKVKIDKTKQLLIKKEFSASLIKKYGLAKPSTMLYEGKGCVACQKTGYKGRLGIFEVLDMTDEIKRLVMSEANATDIKEQAIKQGMLPIIEDGLIKALDGRTTIDEVLRVSKE